MQPQEEGSPAGVAWCSADFPHSHFWFWALFRPWGRDRSQSPPCWFPRMKWIQQSTAPTFTVGARPRLRSAPESCRFLINKHWHTSVDKRSKQYDRGCSQHSLHSTIHWPNAVLMLGQRLRRCPSINPALGQCIIVFAIETFFPSVGDVWCQTVCTTSPQSAKYINPLWTRDAWSLEPNSGSGLQVSKKQKCFFPAHMYSFNIEGSLCDREVACLASDHQGSNFESCVW